LSGTSTPRPAIAAGRPCERYVRSGTASERTRGSAFTAIASHLRSFSLLRQEELPEVADVLHLVELLLGQLDVVLVLDRRDQLDQVERIGGEVLGETDVHPHLLGLDTEDLGGKLLKLREVEFIRHRVSPGQLRSARRSTSVALWPPNPNEFEMATSTWALRAWFGT